MTEMKIGKVCRSARRRRDLTQSQVAQITGYSVENICAFENGRNRNMNILLFYIVECGVSLNELRGCYYGNKAI